MPKRQRLLAPLIASWAIDRDENNTYQRFTTTMMELVYLNLIYIILAVKSNFSAPNIIDIPAWLCNNR